MRQVFSSRARTSSAALLALVASSVAFRLPAFLNAEGVNSDAGIVGLQAMHIQRGELSWFLFGSGYQTSVDSVIAALFFTVAGASALVLMVSAFVGHLAATLLAFATLRRHVTAGLAFLLTLPLVVTPGAVHTYVLHPPRQASLTLVFVSIWLLDAAAHARSPRLRYAAGSAVMTLACFADPYALLFLPPLALLAVLAALDGSPARAVVMTRIGVCTVGAALGVVPLVLLMRSPQSVHGEATLTASVFAHNWRLFCDTCMPWLLSTTAFVGRPEGWGPWVAPAWFRAVQLVGAALFVAGFLFAGLALRMRTIPWEIRRLGIFGLVVLALTVVGFLGSVMVMDLFSTRYLAAIVLASPFALAPAACALRGRRFAFALAPYAVSAGVAGWLAFSPWVDGPRIVRTPSGTAHHERQLAVMLHERGVACAMADYWVAYRLTLLFDEKIVVVPTHKREDRYPPYRAAFDSAPVVAYIFDPDRSREDMASMETQLRSAGVKIGRTEILQAGTLTALVVHRLEI